MWAYVRLFAVDDVWLDGQLFASTLMMYVGTLETTLSTLDTCTNMDEEPALKRPKYVAVAAKKTNFVTFK